MQIGDSLLADRDGVVVDSLQPGRRLEFRAIRRLALASTVVTILLIAIGGVVRATGSGLGCPGWPRCFGRWIPPLQYHAVIEYSHRLAATADVLLIGAFAVLAALRYRRYRRIFIPAIAGLVLVVFQAALGGIVVKGELKSILVAAHFATAMALLGVLTYGSVAALWPDIPAGRPRDRFSKLAVITATAIFVLLVLGAYVRGAGASLAFRDWPLLNGGLVPDPGSFRQALHFLHRVVAALAGVLVVVVAIHARRERKEQKVVPMLASALLVLFMAQVMVGAANVWSRLATAAVAAHVALAGVIWALTVATATTASLGARADHQIPPAIGRAGVSPLRTLREAPSSQRLHFDVRRVVLRYIRLTKPRIVLLLLVTTVPSMMLAAGRVPSLWLIGATLLGGTALAGGANAINQYLEREIDGLMMRTRHRPLPSRLIEPRRALMFGLALGAGGFLWLALTVNLLAGLLALSGFVFYLLVYTAWLKPSSPQNIVIGGAAGAVPVLVGWAAVTGRVGLPALVLFAVVFLWTPPHFWALALRYEQDYSAAGIPMLPVVAGTNETTKRILRYSFVLVGSTLGLVPVAHMGVTYFVSAVGLGAVFVARAEQLRRARTVAAAVRLFRYSIVYLTLLFGTIALDVLLPHGWLGT